MPDSTHLIQYSLIALGLTLAAPLAVLLLSIAFSCFVAWLDERRREQEARDLAVYSDQPQEQPTLEINWSEADTLPFDLPAPKVK